VIAVALGVIAAVLLLAVGVVTAAATPDSLTFFGASIRTTSAQIFLIGAICTWALLVACWLLMLGIRRSRERGEQLAEARRRRSANRAGSADALSLTAFDRGDAALADRTGLRGGSNWNPATDEGFQARSVHPLSQSQPVEE
jgi:uncharacterized protein HemY